MSQQHVVPYLLLTIMEHRDNAKAPAGGGGGWQQSPLIEGGTSPTQTPQPEPPLDEVGEDKDDLSSVFSAVGPDEDGGVSAEHCAKLAERLQAENGGTDAHIQHHTGFPFCRTNNYPCTGPGEVQGAALTAQDFLLQCLIRSTVADCTHVSSTFGMLGGLVEHLSPAVMKLLAEKLKELIREMEAIISDVHAATTKEEALNPSTLVQGGLDPQARKRPEGEAVATAIKRQKVCGGDAGDCAAPVEKEEVEGEISPDVAWIVSKLLNITSKLSGNNKLSPSEDALGALWSFGKALKYGTPWHDTTRPPNERRFSNAAVHFLWKTKGHEVTKSAVKAFLLACKSRPSVHDDWDVKFDTEPDMKKELWRGVQAEANAALAAGRKTGG